MRERETSAQEEGGVREKAKSQLQKRAHLCDAEVLDGRDLEAAQVQLAVINRGYARGGTVYDLCGEPHGEVER